MIKLILQYVNNQFESCIAKNETLHQNTKEISMPKFPYSFSSKFDINSKGMLRMILRTLNLSPKGSYPKCVRSLNLGYKSILVSRGRLTTCQVVGLHIWEMIDTVTK